ncbi:hypothetical protein T03_5405 [Trichinella britovi]|uniref:Uncharacterized protein n=1 Tax=Trichinella britovi TaxID=45882 RepID=A0A0V0ZN37_TRIBR|nr:hypothetical protein T03_5405 [Trichinella britovi]
MTLTFTIQSKYKLSDKKSENQLAQMKLILSEQFAGKSLLMVN